MKLGHSHLHNTTFFRKYHLKVLNVTEWFQKISTNQSKLSRFLSSISQKFLGALTLSSDLVTIPAPLTITQFGNFSKKQNQFKISNFQMQFWKIPPLYHHTVLHSPPKSQNHSH